MLHLFCQNCNKVVVAKRLDQPQQDGIALCPLCGALLPARRHIADGTIINGFKIEKELGHGGMGVVYQAQQLSLNRDIALKILPDEKASNETFIEAFFREARAAASLNHPNIVQAYDAGKTDNEIYFFAMELIKGKNLEDTIAEHGPLDYQTVFMCSICVAKALAYAWDTKKIAHRDIKPSNIILTDNGECKLADLGLAKDFPDEEVESNDEIIATPAYAAPEIICGQKNKNAFKSDMYSFGATLYQLFSGFAPFDGPTITEVCKKQVSERIRPLYTIKPELPRKLSDLIDKLMEKDPEKRPGSWHSVVDSLSEISDEFSAPAEIRIKTKIQIPEQDVCPSKKSEQCENIELDIPIKDAKKSTPPLKIPLKQSPLSIQNHQTAPQSSSVSVPPPPEVNKGPVQNDIVEIQISSHDSANTPASAPSENSSPDTQQDSDSQEMPDTDFLKRFCIALTKLILLVLVLFAAYVILLSDQMDEKSIYCRIFGPPQHWEITALFEESTPPETVTGKSSANFSEMSPIRQKKLLAAYKELENSLKQISSGHMDAKAKEILARPLENDPLLTLQTKKILAANILLQNPKAAAADSERVKLLRDAFKILSCPRCKEKYIVPCPVCQSTEALEKRQKELEEEQRKKQEEKKRNAKKNHGSPFGSISFNSPSATLQKQSPKKKNEPIKKQSCKTCKNTTFVACPECKKNAELFLKQESEKLIQYTHSRYLELEKAIKGQ